MRSTQTIRRLAAICALVVAGTVFTASPAYAGTTNTSFLFGGSIPAETDYQAYVVTQLYETGTPGQSRTFSYTQLHLGRYGKITATGCQLETWLTLSYSPPGQSAWDSPHWTFPDCTDFFTTNQGGWPQEGHTPAFNTAASWIYTHFCITLSWGSSTHTRNCFSANWTQTS